jgi:hypothetical protein
MWSFRVTPIDDLYEGTTNSSRFFSREAFSEVLPPGVSTVEVLAGRVKSISLMISVISLTVYWRFPLGGAMKVAGTCLAHGSTTWTAAKGCGEW